VLFEPQPDDYWMFFTNIFSFASRKAVCEAAYRATRRDLLRRYDEVSEVLGRHGIRLRRDVLLDPMRDLWAGVGLEGGPWRDRVAGDLPLTKALDRALRSLERWIDGQEVEGGASDAATADVTAASADPTSAEMAPESLTGAWPGGEHRGTRILRTRERVGARRAKARGGRRKPS
jgi:hypothetical protein